MRRLRSTLTAAIVLCGLFFSVATAPANADTGPVLGNSPANAAPTGSVQGSGNSTGVQPEFVITCTGQIDNPHKSTHFPGTVNVEASVRCTSPVSALSMQTALYRNGVLLGFYPNGNTGSSSLSGAFAEPCVTGTYIGEAAILVIFPPGFVPPAGYILVASPPVPISC